MAGLRWLLPDGAHIWNIWSQQLGSGLGDVPSVQTRECLSLLFAGAGEPFGILTALLPWFILAGTPTAVLGLCCAQQDPTQGHGQALCFSGSCRAVQQTRPVRSLKARTQTQCTGNCSAAWELTKKPL